MAFEGIPYGMGEFFMQIRFNNHQAFFEEHRAAYLRDVREPLYALAEALSDAVQAVDPAIETRPGKVVSRIRRDTRFSRDKSPYRDNMWISWKQPRFTDEDQKRSLPEIYFYITPDRWEIGAGYYAATPSAMTAFRARVLAAPNVFLSIAREKPFADTFALSGEDYKRPPKGADALPAELLSWFVKKSFSVGHGSPLGESSRTPAFADELAGKIALLGPLYDYLITLPIE